MNKNFFKNFIRFTSFTVYGAITFASGHTAHADVGVTLSHPQVNESQRIVHTDNKLSTTHHSSILADLTSVAARIIHHSALAFMHTLSHSSSLPSPSSVQTQYPAPLNPDSAAAATVDETHTALGNIGKYMLQFTGQPANFLGEKFQGKGLLEPINLVIVDETSQTSQESVSEINKLMDEAGYPARIGHSSGYRGKFNQVEYSQQPAGFGFAFSNNFFIFPSNHTRALGPAKTQQGYVWTESVSREKVILRDGIIPDHGYVSFNAARDDLAKHLDRINGVKELGILNLENKVSNSTTTTGDHDGYAPVFAITSAPQASDSHIISPPKISLLD